MIAHPPGPIKLKSPRLPSRAPHVVPTALPAFNALASLYQIDPSPPNATKPPATQVKKHMPLSYQSAASFAPGRTPLVFTDSTYSCALQAPPPKPFKTPATAQSENRLGQGHRHPAAQSGAGRRGRADPHTQDHHHAVRSIEGRRIRARHALAQQRRGGVARHAGRAEALRDAHPDPHRSTRSLHAGAVSRGQPAARQINVLAFTRARARKSH
jgi:hypothetical protein